ncbi:FAD-dependent monooxygenase [Actinocrispum sp. NPDC049592]|uniref:FAD-dependent oxidoreductase n=1 Tax=Actinocrispum sp. NPDC049592 TaxID=3154835 RepID=UPI00344122FB
MTDPGVPRDSHDPARPATNLRVLVIGGGIGGLCLAQGLRAEGIDVTVFDRAPSMTTGRQGYGFHINETGDAALSACLPTHLYELYRATASPAATGDFVLFTAGLREILRRPLPAQTVDRPRVGVGVNRQTLREILSAELGDAIRYNSEFRRYDTGPAGRLRAHFADGAGEDADLIVGADGADSAVRGQLVPDAGFDDFGRSIYGRTPLTPALTDRIPPDFLHGMARAKDDRGRTLGAARFTAIEPFPRATARLAPHVRLTATGDYLRWTLSLREEGLVGARRFWGSTGPALQAIAEDLVATWHPGLRAIIDNADAEATYPFGIFCARPVQRWSQPGVTLLGDAIHTMTPGRGEGANTALRDAALLTARLADVAAGRSALSTAIAAYETEMLRYGFEAVENSRRPYFAAPMKPRG